MRFAVVGAGSWGTALAQLLARNGHTVRLWSYEEDVVRSIQETGENQKYLPGIQLSPDLLVSSRMEDVIPGARIVLSVSPSQHVRQVMRDAVRLMDADAIVVSASKGIEVGTLERMDQVLLSLLPPGGEDRLVVLSGPSFAAEVARMMPTAVVAAGTSVQACNEVQLVFNTPTFRVYTIRDVVGVELGGALKNVVALAAGVVAGLEFGHNALAALITRGLAEMTRLGVAMGAEAATFYGLAGLGDLVLTCTGDLSRNRTVGARLARGETLEAILADMQAVAEGVRTTPAVHALARKYGVEMPIVDQVYAILEEGKAPLDAFQELMLREPRQES
ncbi:MAG: NAD(P)-dependent glycerol-3-phosphate dehydrogenase [Gemmatimonadetes bacterium]|nr:NAD(P)-dependent glycerol-3-phosphate dehydrogenase [Gemmatimonadota bacterium]